MGDVREEPDRLARDPVSCRCLTTEAIRQRVTMRMDGHVRPNLPRLEDSQARVWGLSCPVPRMPDGSNLREDSKSIAERADGSNYRDDEETDSEMGDGSSLRDDSRGISDEADGSNYQRPA